MRFLGHDADGRSGADRSFLLAAGRSVTYADVLGSLFGSGEAWGAVQLRSASPSLVATSQTWTPGGGGTFGQSVPLVPETELIRSGTSRTIPAVREDGSFRTNLILANGTEAPVDVDVSLVSETGAVLGSRRWSLLPLGMTQVSRVVRELGVSAERLGRAARRLDADGGRRLRRLRLRHRREDERPADAAAEVGRKGSTPPGSNRPGPGREGTAPRAGRARGARLAQCPPRPPPEPAGRPWDARTGRTLRYPRHGFPGFGRPSSPSHASPTTSRSSRPGPSGPFAAGSSARRRSTRRVPPGGSARRRRERPRPSPRRPPGRCRLPVRSRGRSAFPGRPGGPRAPRRAAPRTPR